MVRLRGPFPGGIPNAAVLVKQRMLAVGTSPGVGAIIIQERKTGNGNLRKLWEENDFWS